MCRDKSLLVLNSQSNVFFHEQYSTEQLPMQLIEEYDRVNGMDGQIEDALCNGGELSNDL